MNGGTAGEDESAEVKDEWRDAILQYTPILEIQEHNDKKFQILGQLNLKTEKALKAGCSKNTVKSWKCY